ncbi:hypothetical protein GFS24_02090 [Chitinophaga sp. SYP-B3965]|uniref:hypothetical protein n=1 Tax=Chitinophaga sp. SYP-B3965 TaxID=2663120 RepID=UPI001299F779|nr:hypothetical protein [Chitinophaga sp. SYP-B3965]MRG43882.1 hypothetical protein [Chitinophaga sp. SYP-B3965]
MKASTGANSFPDTKGLIEDVFHEIRSILSSILSSVELIELYGERAVAGDKIGRQTGSIKLQVIELEFLLQNVRIIQHILNKTITVKRLPVNVSHLFRNLLRDDRYAPLFAPWAKFNVHNNREVAYVDENLLKQLVLNLLFRMRRNSLDKTTPSLVFNFEADHIVITGTYTANAGDQSFSSSIKTFEPGNLQAFLDQRICSLINYVAELHEGTFDISGIGEGQIEMLVRIPYDVA